MCMSSPKIPAPAPPPPPPPAPAPLAKTAMTAKQSQRSAGQSATRGVSALRIRRPSVRTSASGSGVNISY